MMNEKKHEWLRQTRVLKNKFVQLAIKMHELDNMIIEAETPQDLKEIRDAIRDIRYTLQS